MSDLLSQREFHKALEGVRVSAGMRWSMLDGVCLSVVMEQAV